MKKRKLKQKASKSSATDKVPAPQPEQVPIPRQSSAWWAVAAGGLAIAVGVWYWVNHNRPGEPDSSPVPPSAAKAPGDSSIAQGPGKQDGSGEGAGGKAPGDSFLEDFGKAGGEGDPEGPALSDDELETRFRALAETNERLKAQAKEFVAKQGKLSPQELRTALGERKRLTSQLDRGLPAFEKDLARARKARPDGAVPAWLTGETLILIGGEPQEILPHLERALKGGLRRPHLLASLARTQTQGNQFAEALQSATRALDLDGKDRYAWNAYVRASVNLERFAVALARLDKTFPAERPAWADALRREVVAWQARWQAEEKRREAEQRADDLPRVRLIIEHRRFARGAKGAALTTIESTGKGEVLLELFEDQAPAAVASFLSLVAQKEYDGTRFHLAEPAAVVVGGDIKSRTGDPRDDGTGEPGYFIPDEFERPDARPHFRGSISLGNNGPGTTGCQFSINLVPMHEMDGRYTVFGRVLKGQEVIDRITPGRTNPEVGRFGRIIPGDLLVRAEVLRKRAHEYRVTKLPSK
jgi:cyclophilin family peptidyl-prolyl cis-trans isomerase